MLCYVENVKDSVKVGHCGCYIPAYFVRTIVIYKRLDYSVVSKKIGSRRCLVLYHIPIFCQSYRF